MKNVFDERKRTLSFDKKIVSSSTKCVIEDFPTEYSQIRELVHTGEGLALVSFTNNNFHDNTILNVSEFLQNIIGYDPVTSKIRVEIIDLSNNSIEGALKSTECFINTLLNKLQPAGFVDVTFNPIRISEKTHLLHSLYGSTNWVDTALKLIWIPDYKLALTIWYTFIPESETKQTMINQTYDAHKRYYTLRKHLPS